MGSVQKVALMIATAVWLVGLGGVVAENVEPGGAYVIGALMTLSLLAAWRWPLD